MITFSDSVLRMFYGKEFFHFNLYYLLQNTVDLLENILTLYIMSVQGVVDQSKSDKVLS